MKQTIISINLHNNLQNIPPSNSFIFPLDEIPEPRLSQGRKPKNVNPFMLKEARSMNGSTNTKGILSASPARPSRFVYENGIPSFSSNAGLIILNPFIKKDSLTSPQRLIKAKNKMPMKSDMGTSIEFNFLQNKVTSNDIVNEDYASNLNSSGLSTSRYLKKIEWKNKIVLPETLNSSIKYSDHNNKHSKFDPNNSKAFQYYISNVLNDPFKPYRFSLNTEKTISKPPRNELRQKSMTIDKFDDFQKRESPFQEIKHNPIHSFNGYKIEHFKTVKSVSSNRKIFFKKTTLTRGQQLLMEKQSLLKISTSRPSTAIANRSQIKRSTEPNVGISVEETIPFKNELIITKVLKVIDMPMNYYNFIGKEFLKMKSSFIESC